jgi:hypothetical protein
VDQAVLPESIKQEDPNKIMVPLLGKVKGDIMPVSTSYTVKLLPLQRHLSSFGIDDFFEFIEDTVKLKHLSFATRMDSDWDLEFSISTSFGRV